MTDSMKTAAGHAVYRTSRESTRARNRLLGAASAASAIVVAFSGSASAGARAIPDRVVPGEVVALVYSPDASSVEVGVLANVSCSVAAPDGSSFACGSTEGVLDVHVASQARRYGFEFVAPDALGVYTVTFTRAATVGVALPPPPGPAHETTSFEVVAPEDGPVASRAVAVGRLGSTAAVILGVSLAPGAAFAGVALARRDREGP